MIRHVCVPVSEHCEKIAEDFGLERAVSLSLAHVLGGLWHVSDQGVGFEFLKPFRSCVVSDYVAWAAHFARENGLSCRELEVNVLERDPSPPEN